MFGIGAAAGGATGGIVVALIGMDIPEDEARFYEKELKRAESSWVFTRIVWMKPRPFWTAAAGVTPTRSPCERPQPSRDRFPSGSNSFPGFADALKQRIAKHRLAIRKPLEALSFRRAGSVSDRRTPPETPVAHAACSPKR